MSEFRGEEVGRAGGCSGWGRAVAMTGETEAQRHLALAPGRNLNLCLWSCCCELFPYIDGL